MEKTKPTKSRMSVANARFYLKAQTSEIFFFILAIVIIGLLLLFGVKYIMELGTKVNQIDMLRFKTDLEGYAQEIRPVYGKWQKIPLDVPPGIDKVCFVQQETFTESPLYIQQEGICTKGHEDYNLLMCSAWQGDLTRNVFTEPFDELEVGIDVGSLEVGSAYEQYLCFDTTSGLLKIKMTGKGDRVLLEKWE